MNDPELFVVRVWRQLAAGFRASARRVDDEQTHLFSRPDDLARFLTGPAQTDATPDDGQPRGNPPASTAD